MPYWYDEYVNPESQRVRALCVGRHPFLSDHIARYLREGRVPHGLSRRGEHGTQVASIAAGRRCGEFGGGLAPEARLLVVIPSAGVPTGYSTAHLDALSFIDRMATSLAAV